MTLTEAFGRRLQDLRVAGGLTQGQLASKCRLSSSTISKAELGQREPRLWLILILCDGLGLSPQELIGGLTAPQERRTT